MGLPANEEQFGLIAQEVEKVFPGLVITGPDGFKRIKVQELPFYIIAAMKEQQRQIEDLKTGLAEQIKVLQAQVMSLQARTAPAATANGAR